MGREMQKPDEKNFGQEDFLEFDKKPNSEEYNLESDQEDNQKKEELLATKGDYVNPNDLSFISSPSENFEDIDTGKNTSDVLNIEL